MMKDKYVYPRQTGISMSPGMELRDWFAGQALVGWLADGTDSNAYHVAREAYAIADAMMEIRNEEQN
jgi:hypothetical protein